MKRKEINLRELINSRQLLRAGSVLLATVILGVSAWNAGSTVKDDEFILTSFVDMDEEIMIGEEEVPLTSAPKVTVKTTKTKKVVKLKNKAKKTYTKKLTPKTVTTTSTKQTASANAITTTTTEKETTTSVSEKYKKNSKKKTVTTTKKVKTTVTTVTKANAAATASAASASGAAVSNTGATVVQSSVASRSAQSQSPYTVDITKLAPKVDPRVIKAYQGLNFDITVDGSVPYGGYFNARNQNITMREENDTIYHELGHFAAFAAGNVDTKAEFTAIYEEEKTKFTGARRVYASQSSSEYFAECFREYTLRPAELRSCCPKTYDAITAALDKITDARITQLNTIFGCVWNKD